ncbi:MAG: hypothetical protein JWR52_1481 [Marmoricola sp.]|nr:hypothetical protein [Marmoricola sp.]
MMQTRLIRPPRRILRGTLMALASVVAIVTMTAAPSQAVACPTGTWPYHQGLPGGCGYGRWSKGVDYLGRPWFKLAGTVGDRLADGSCARVEVKIRVTWVSDSTQTYRVCGNGRTTAINFYDIDSSSGFIGSVQAWSVRLCVGGTCTRYVDFVP